MITLALKQSFNAPNIQMYSMACQRLRICKHFLNVFNTQKLCIVNTRHGSTFILQRTGAICNSTVINCSSKFLRTHKHLDIIITGKRLFQKPFKPKTTKKTGIGKNFGKVKNDTLVYSCTNVTSYINIITAFCLMMGVSGPYWGYLVAVHMEQTKESEEMKNKMFTTRWIYKLAGSKNFLVSLCIFLSMSLLFPL